MHQFLFVFARFFKKNLEVLFKRPGVAGAMILYLIFLCLLYATNGGSGNTSCRWDTFFISLATIGFFNDVLDAYNAFFVGFQAFVEGFNIGWVFFLLPFRQKKFTKKELLQQINFGNTGDHYFFASIHHSFAFN